MDNRRVLLAVLLSLAVLIGFEYLFRPAAPPPEAPDAGAPGVEERIATGAEGSPDAPATGEPATGQPATAETAPPEPAEPEELVQADREREVVVDSELFRAVFTNRGAQLTSFVLKNHRSYGGGLVDLVREREEGPYPFGLVGGGGGPLELNDALFTVQRDVQGGEEVLTFRYSGPEGRAEKRFRFQAGGLFDVVVEVARPDAWALFAGPGIRNPSVGELENRFERRSVAFEMQGQDVERFEAPGLEGLEQISALGLQWVALEDTYFLAAFMPQEGLARAEIIPYLMRRGEEEDEGWSFVPLPPEDRLTEEQEELGRDLVLLLWPQGNADVLDLESYWGAKKYQRLADLEPYDLERTINIWSWFRPIAVPILWALLWIHDNLVHNYGWAIVLVTVLIKLLLAPLTHKSFVSMRKMQALHPQMQAIREKWRGKLRDKSGKMNLEAQRQMNEEMQQLYRSAGVNPAGGCLPMLLQMPVLFAFYQLLTAAVELRDAPWILWIHDLSQPDPIYALPIIMGVTQFLQQRLTPMAGDPMQRKIMQAMPVIWTVFFLGFPSGLVLYWLTNNLLTILQQWALNRFMPSSTQDEPAPGKKKAKAQKGSRDSRRVASK